MHRSVIAILAIAALLGGCAGTSEKTRLEKFEDTSRAYGKFIEWSSFDKAAMLTRHPDHRVLQPDLTPYTGIKVTSYQPMGAVMGADGKTIQRAVQIRYIVMSRMSEKTQAVTEEWTYSDKDERWYLKSGLPVLK